MPRCKVCSNESFEKLKIFPISVYDEIKYDLIRCQKCGVVFTDPMPSAEKLDFLYENLYFYESHRIIEKEKKFRAQKLASYIKKIGNARKILEIGPMYGQLMEELRNLGMDSSGIEIDEDAVGYCVKRGLDVKKMHFSDFLSQEKDNKYNLIILSHVQEHLLSPKEDMIKLKRHLTDNGKILMIVPNINSMTARIFGKYWGYWDVPAHTSHFNQRSVANFLKSCNLEIIDLHLLGGSSLLFFSSISKLLGVSAKKIKITDTRKKILKIISSVLKYWYFAGNDEILVVAKKLKNNDV
jgi:2-polyprenyl-3-methyl-5-hydroxy-6-metoxy-1,4-benzoquinol methylase